MLKEAGKGQAVGNDRDALDEPVDFSFSDFAVDPETVMEAQFEAFPSSSGPGSAPILGPPFSDMPTTRDKKSAPSNELIDLGLFEPLPPFEVMEELYGLVLYACLVLVMLTLAATRYSSNGNTNSSPSSIQASIHILSIRRHISGPRCACSMPSGPWPPTHTKSTQPIMTCSTLGLGNISTLMK